MVRDLTIRSWPEPTNKTQLQSFLGLANYYRSFCMGFSNAAAPLYGLTRKAPWTFDEGHKMAFSHVKNAVLASVSRTRFDPELPLNCYTDASGFGIGAVMLQKEFPVAIVSRALVERETMGPGYWDQNGGSPQWVPGTPETLVRQLWGR